MDANTWLVPSAASQNTEMAAAINSRLQAGKLFITSEDARALAELRMESLHELERVEFGTPAIVAIADAVATSSSLSQSRLASDLAELQTVFYRLRDELPASVPDSEIVNALRDCLDAQGDAELVTALETDEIMRCSDEYLQALNAASSDEYRIVDDEGRVYTFSPSEWEYDERANGWDGERWSDDWND